MIILNEGEKRRGRGEGLLPNQRDPISLEEKILEDIAKFHKALIKILFSMSKSDA